MEQGHADRLQMVLLSVSFPRQKKGQYRSEEHTSNSSHSQIYPLSLHDALPICPVIPVRIRGWSKVMPIGSKWYYFLLAFRGRKRVSIDRKSTRRTPVTAKSTLFPYTTLFRSARLSRLESGDGARSCRSAPNGTTFC